VVVVSGVGVVLVVVEVVVLVVALDDDKWRVLLDSGPIEADRRRSLGVGACSALLVLVVPAHELPVRSTGLERRVNCEGIE